MKSTILITLIVAITLPPFRILRLRQNSPRRTYPKYRLPLYSDKDAQLILSFQKNSSPSLMIRVTILDRASLLMRTVCRSVIVKMRLSKTVDRMNAIVKALTPLSILCTGVSGVHLRCFLIKMTIAHKNDA